MVVGDRIRERLGVVGLSQSELARRIGVSQPMINALIRGASRSSPKLHQIARELRTTPAYLSGETNDPSADAPAIPDLSFYERRLLSCVSAIGEVERSALMTIAVALAAKAAQEERV